MKNVQKIYIVLVVLAVGYILFSMFSNRKVLGTQEQLKEAID